jgi:phosphoglycolate phosphatase
VTVGGPTPTAFLDLDGPLLDVSRKHYELYCDLVKGFVGVPLSFDDFWECKRQRVSDRNILERSGLASRAEEYSARKVELIETDAYLAFDTIQQGAMEVLSALKDNFMLVLVTLRRSRLALDLQLSRLGLDRALDRVLTSSDVAAADHAEGWRIKSQLVRDAGFCTGPSDFFAGDTETDIRAGQDLGTRTVAVVNGIRDDRFLLPLRPTVVVSTISDFGNVGLLSRLEVPQ